MRRIIIVGNSGSGKTYLAQRLGDRYGLPVIHLDDLFWEPGGFNRQRPKEIVRAEIASFAQTGAWVVEGVFGDLVEVFCTRADSLIWLDLDWEVCSQNLLKRGLERSRQSDSNETEESFQALLKWASEYRDRDGLRSYRGHKLLFDRFNRSKTCLKTRESINEFIASVIAS